MKPENETLPPTKELPLKELPPCRCRASQSGTWPAGAENQWLLVKPTDTDEKQPQLIEYECLSCNRRYRLRGNKLFEVARDGSEHAYMRQGRYGRWLSCR